MPVTEMRFDADWMDRVFFFGMGTSFARDCQKPVNRLITPFLSGSNRMFRFAKHSNFYII
jgi:hypothetical protein